MRRINKVKALATRSLSRKAVLSASAAARRPFPAWIADDEAGGVAFPAKAIVTPRVRDGLVLRVVTKQKPSSEKPASAKGSTHEHGAR